jgi:hypothetical protein
VARGVGQVLHKIIFYRRIFHSGTRREQKSNSSDFSANIEPNFLVHPGNSGVILSTELNFIFYKNHYWMKI